MLKLGGGVFLALFFAGCSTDSPVTPDISGNSFNARLEAAIDSEDSISVLNINEWNEISGPCIITESGCYTVIKDFSTDGSSHGIVISGVNHVYLDLNGHTISGNSSYRNFSGVYVDSSEFILVSNGTLSAHTYGVTFNETSKGSVKDVVINSGYTDSKSPPPHYIGVNIVNSDRIKVLWNVISHIEKGVQVYGVGSALNRIANNTIIGGTYTTGKTGILYYDTEFSPSDDIIRNNTISKFLTGISADTFNGYLNFTNNKIEYYNYSYLNTDSTNQFKNNVYIKIMQ